MVLSLRTSRLARQVWATEEQAFVAGATWFAVGPGEAVVHPDIPEVWDASFVGRVRDPQADAVRLYTLATRALVRAGCGHVKIVLDEAACFRTVGRALRDMGLLQRAYVTMATRKPPPASVLRPGVQVRAVAGPADRRAMARVRDEVRQEAPWYTPGVSVALDAWEDAQSGSLDLTWLVGYLDGEPAGAVGLLVTDHGASLQSLATVPRLRRRGVAAALVREVVVRGLARGAPFVSLLTDRDDTPRHMYRRLGFREVAEVREYLRAL